MRARARARAHTHTHTPGPAAMAKYAADPEIMGLMMKIQSKMGGGGGMPGMPGERFDKREGVQERWGDCMDVKYVDTRTRTHTYRNAWRWRDAWGLRRHGRHGRYCRQHMLINILTQVSTLA